MENTPESHPHTSTSTPVLAVRTPIKLGQFLKLAGVVEDGVHAREVISAGIVKVDGAVETRRGCQLSAGALIQICAPAPHLGITAPVELQVGQRS